MKRTQVRDTVSPPPLKRQHLVPPKKLLSHSTAKPAAPASSFRIFSWNINGIQIFLPDTNAAPITSFFKPASPRNSAASLNSTLQAQRSPHSLRSFLARHKWPEVLFLQEVKIEHGDVKTTSALLAALNTPLPSEDEPAGQSRTYTLDLNLPHDRFNARGIGGKLYGVATIIRSDFAAQWDATVRHADWECEGRVSIVELSELSTAATSTESRVALINVYAVNGTSAEYRSPETGKPAGTRHDFKIAFHSMLRDECLALEERGFDVVAAGDLNVARGVLDGHPGLRTWPAQHRANRADFNAKFFGLDDCESAKAYVLEPETSRTAEKISGEAREDTPGLNGVDVFRALHGLERRYTYYPTTKPWGASCDRVDLIIVSRKLWDRGGVVDTGILDSPQERGPSDHVPLWVELWGVAALNRKK